MSLIRVLRTRRFWVGVGVAVLMWLAICALGTTLIARGAVLPQTMALWGLIAYGLAGLIGTWVAAKEGEGTLLHAGALAVVFFALVCLIALCATGNVYLSDGGWKGAVCLLGGALLGGLLRSSGKKARKKSRGKGRGVKKRRTVVR